MYIPWWFLTHTTSHPKMHFWVWWFSRIFTRSWDMWSFFSGTPTHLDVVTPPPQRKIDSGFDLTLHFIVKYAGSLKAKIQHSLPNKKSTDLQRAAIFQHLLGGFLQNLQGSNESPMHTSNIYIYRHGNCACYCVQLLDIKWYRYVLYSNIIYIIYIYI